MRANQEITIFHKASIVLGANTLDFAKSGRVMFVGYDDSSVRVWDVLKVRVLGSLWALHQGSLWARPPGITVGLSTGDHYWFVHRGSL